jgi:hypothetical protein
LNDVSKIKKGIDDVIHFRSMIPEQYRTYTDGAFKKGLDKLAASKGGEIDGYIKSVFK